jgi:hypothetical protein
MHLRSLGKSSDTALSPECSAFLHEFDVSLLPRAKTQKFIWDIWSNLRPISDLLERRHASCSGPTIGARHPVYRGDAGFYNLTVGEKQSLVHRIATLTKTEAIGKPEGSLCHAKTSTTAVVPRMTTAAKSSYFQTLYEMYERSGDGISIFCCENLLALFELPVEKAGNMVADVNLSSIGSVYSSLHLDSGKVNLKFHAHLHLFCPFSMS